VLVLVHRTPEGKTGIKVEVGYGLEALLQGSTRPAVLPRAPALPRHHLPGRLDQAAAAHERAAAGLPVASRAAAAQAGRALSRRRRESDLPPARVRAPGDLELLQPGASAAGLERSEQQQHLRRLEQQQRLG
jgi:hypothetical protein